MTTLLVINKRNNPVSSSIIKDRNYYTSTTGCSTSTTHADEKFQHIVENDSGVDEYAVLIMWYPLTDLSKSSLPNTTALNISQTHFQPFEMRTKLVIIIWYGCE